MDGGMVIILASIVLLKNIYKQPKVIFSIIKNTDANQCFDEDE